VPDEILGEAIKAFVVVKNSDLTTNQLKAFLKTRLPAYKLPSFIQRLDTLPKNKAGKIIKKELKEKYSESSNEI